MSTDHRVIKLSCYTLENHEAVKNDDVYLCLWISKMFLISLVNKSKFQNKLFNIMQFIITSGIAFMHIWDMVFHQNVNIDREGAILISLFFSVLSILQHFYSQNKW